VWDGKQEIGSSVNVTKLFLFFFSNITNTYYMAVRGKIKADNPLTQLVMSG
jgi:hypothetical protein